MCSIHTFRRRPTRPICKSCGLPKQMCERHYRQTKKWEKKKVTVSPETMETTTQVRWTSSKTKEQNQMRNFKFSPETLRSPVDVACIFWFFGEYSCFWCRIWTCEHVNMCGITQLQFFALHSNTENKQRHRIMSNKKMCVEYACQNNTNTFTTEMWYVWCVFILFFWYRHLNRPATSEPLRWDHFLSSRHRSFVERW